MDEVTRQLWSLMGEKLDSTCVACALPWTWRRFTQAFSRLCTPELEQALRGALEEQMPRIVQVPSEAEAAAAAAGAEVILRYRDQYFRVVPTTRPSSRAGPEPPDGRQQLMNSVAVIQAWWRARKPRRPSVEETRSSPAPPQVLTEAGL